MDKTLLCFREKLPSFRRVYKVALRNVYCSLLVFGRSSVATGIWMGFPSDTDGQGVSRMSPRRMEAPVNIRKMWEVLARDRISKAAIKTGKQEGAFQDSNSHGD